ncbi:unnamed protein product, partial [Prorocentrum cordatum]
RTMSFDLESLSTPGNKKDLGSCKAELLRHCILMMRLQRPYLVYCLLCAGCATFAFMSTLFGMVSSAGKILPGQAHSILDGGCWQTLCWIIVGWALVIEVFTSAIVNGLRRSLRDFWFVFDAAVLLVTVLAWMLAHSGGPTAPTAREVGEIEGADLALLALRFALQLGRVLAAWLMAHKVTQMQSGFLDVPDVQLHV